MKKVKKIIFAAILSLSAVFLLVACKGKVKAADLLSSFLLEQDNTEVTANFSVQSQLKHGDKTYPLSWTSSDPDHVAISAEENTENSTYDVIVTRPENEDIEVTLTVNLFIKKKNQASKEFKVRLTPIDVYDFSDTFKLEQQGTVIWDDFDLKTSHTVGDKTCSISWASGNENYIKINGTTADVLPSTFETPVKLLGTFEYDNKKTTKEYSLTVYYPMTQEDALIYWYEHTGITQKLEGYVVAKGTYKDEYGEGSLYVIDPSFKGGYYIYQGYIDKAEFEALELGTYVTCTGATNTSHYGLMETNYGGTIKIDKTKAKINVEEKRYAIDNDLVANVNSLYYRLSTPVSLTNWKVKEVKELDAAGGSTQTILKLEKFGVETAVTYSKYFDATPLDASNATFKAVTEKLTTLKAGDWVSIKGILGYYNSSKKSYDQKSYQISIESADAIVAGTEDTATTSPASKVMKQIEAINKVMANYDAIYEAQEITLPTSSDTDVTLTWGFANEYHDSAKIESGKLIVTPGVKSNIFVTATLTNGDYSTTIRFTILVENVDAQEKVNRELHNYNVSSSDDATVDQVQYTGEVKLPETGSTHKDVKFTYKLVGTKPETKEVVLNGNKLTLPVVTEEITITVEVTATIGEGNDQKTASKEVIFYLAVPKACASIADVLKEKNDTAVEFTATAVAETERGYILYDGVTPVYVYIGSKIDEKFKMTVGQTYKVVGIRGYYNGHQVSDLISVTKQETAVPHDNPTPTEYNVEQIEKYVALDNKKYNTEYIKLTGDLSISGSHYNLIVEGTEKGQGSISYPIAAYADKLTALNDCRVTVEGWLIGCSSSKYLNIVITKDPVEVIVTRTDEQAVDYIVKQLQADAKKDVTADKTLATTWEVKGNENTPAITWKDDKDAAITSIKFEAKAESTTYALKATITVGKETKTVDIKYTVPAIEKSSSIADVLAKSKNDMVLVEGTVVAECAKGYVLYDGKDAIFIYAGSSITEAQKCTLNTVVTVIGKRGSYNKGPQIEYTSATVVDGATPAVPAEPVEYLGTKINEVVASEDTELKMEYVSLKGTVTTGNYYNIKVADATNSASIYSITDAQKALLENNKVYEITGWAQSISGGKYFNIIVSEVKAAQLSDEEIVDAVIADLKKDAENPIVADKPLQPSVTKEEKTITLAWTKDNAAITSIAHVQATSDVTVPVSVTVTLNEVTKIVDITYTIPALEKSASIAEVLAKPEGELLIVEGTVVAECARGYILYDGKDTIFIHAGSTSLTEAQKCTLNTVVTVVGTRGTYNKGPQINYTSATVVAGATPAVPENPVEYTGDKINEALASSATELKMEYATIKGTVTISGNYYNFAVAGATCAVSVYSITDAQKALFEDGKTYEITGWVHSISGSTTKYFNIVVSSVKAAQLSDVDYVDLAIAYLKEEAAAPLLADKTLDPSIAVESKTITLAWTKDNAAITSISYVSSETEQKITVSVTATLNEATKTVDITYTIPALKIYTLAEALAAADGTPVKVVGTVKAADAWSDQYNNMSVTITDGTTDLYIYRLATKVALYDKIEITGTMETYSKRKQVAQGATATILTKTDAEAVDEVTLWLDAFAVEGLTANKALPTTYTSNCNTNAATITWTYNGTAVTEVAYDSTIAADTEVEYIVAITLGTEQNVQHTVKFTLISANTKKATLAANVTANTDAAALTTAGTLTTTLGLDATLFTVTYVDKGTTSSELAVRTDGIRMYANGSAQGNKLKIAAAAGSNVTITSIKINYLANYSSTAVISGADGVAITGTFAGNVGTYDVNSTEFTILNDNSSNSSAKQVRFTSIEISYVVNAA